jgi:hypothetical protein
LGPRGGEALADQFALLMSSASILISIQDSRSMQELDEARIELQPEKRTSSRAASSGTWTGLYLRGAVTSSERR